MGYHRKGSEILVNTVTEGWQYSPSMTRLASGGFVVLWRDFTSPYQGQIFDSSGNRVGGEFVTDGTEVAALPDGGFVAMWNNGQVLLAQRHDSAGAPVGSTVFAKSTAGSVGSGSIATLASGGFVISWSQSDYNGDSAVRAQVFDASGAKLGSEFAVHDVSAARDTHGDPDVTGLAGGGFVVTWEGEGAIRAQVFTAAGARVGGQLQVSSETRWMNNPQIAALASGGFVVVWTKATSMFGSEENQGIYAQVFSASGARVGTERVIAFDGPDNLFDSLDVAALSTGGFVISWSSAIRTGRDTSGTAVKVQVVDHLGNEVGGELIVNTTTDGDQYAPVVTGLPSGDFVVSWTDRSATGGDTDGAAIRSQLFHDGPAIEGTADDDKLSGTSRSDSMMGLAGDDVLWGGAGADTLDGGSGGDYLEGGLGNDVYHVDSLSDTVEEFRDQGIDEVRTALGTRTQVYTLPVFVENLTGTSETAQAVEGNSFDNLIIMGAGNDLVILDDGGNDIVAGGAGNDFFYFGNAWNSADRVDGGGGIDTIGLIGSTIITLDEGSMIGVERLALYSGLPNQPAHYLIKTKDGTIPRFGELFVTAASLKANESLVFDGRAEWDGRFTVHGGAGHDWISGGDYHDFIIGNAGDDMLFGQEGRDVFVGGLGADQMKGGMDSDRFTYLSTDQSTASSRDHILDFQYHPDLIDLSAIDANGNAADGNSAFTFIGSAAFGNIAGQLRAYQSGSDWIVEGDVNGDGNADLVIQVTLHDNYGEQSLVAGDFVL